MYTTINDLKKHLNIEPEFIDDDIYITGLIMVAESTVKNYCNGGLDEYTDLTIPIEIKQCVLLFAAHLYMNRQLVSFTQAYKIHYSFEFMLSNFKNYTIK